MATKGRGAVVRDSARAKRHICIICVLLILVTAATYCRVVSYGFINLDDDPMAKENPMVLAGLSLATVQRAFTTPYAANWTPLAWLSYAVDRHIAADLLRVDPPVVHHAANLLLHILNSVLLFLCLLKLTKSVWRSAFVAFLFALHPLHVESVAWIAERRDVLSTALWMLTMLAYARYIDRPTFPRYGLIVVLFALGLTAKPMLVSLPFVLLLLDFWPLGRFTSKNGIDGKRASRLIWEKVPLLILSVAGCGVTIWAQNCGGAVKSLGFYPVGVRVANAFVCYIHYITLMLWPRGLAAYYPHPESTLPLWQVIGSGFLFCAVSAFAVRAGRSRPYFVVGWLWYVITLIPVIGLVQVGMQAMADRYTYVPLIGLFIVISWGAPDILLSATAIVEQQRVALLRLASCAVIVILSALTYVQVGCWRDSITLFRHAVRVTGPNAQAHYNLGLAYAVEGNADEAINQYRQSLQIDPRNPEVAHRLGCILTLRGRQADLDEAIRLFRTALKHYPSMELTHNWLGMALLKKGRTDEAIAEFRHALEINPGLVEAQMNLDDALAKRKH